MTTETERRAPAAAVEAAREPSRALRVVVVTSDVPFVRGGHRIIAENLAAALERSGHLAEMVKTPQNPFGKQFSAYLANWCTDLSETGDGLPVDRVITTRFPSYAVRHPHHVCWLNHRMREYYDLWPSFRRRLSRKGRLKESVRRFLIHRADNYLLARNVKKLFVQSKTIGERLRESGVIDFEVLYPPPPERAYRTDSYDDYVFAVSRLHPLKRVDLLVKAMKQVKSKTLRAVIAGTGEEEESLKALAAELGVASRITFLGHISDEELLDHYARCRGVFFAPFMEDYGFVTLEAFRSRKPVLTCMDSGGPAELVSIGRSGYVLLPEPFQIAQQLDVWSENRQLAVRMGENGEADTREIQWPAAVERLLMDPRDSA